MKSGTMATKLKKRYQPLMKKYKLPGFDELDLEFEIGSIESADFLLGEIRKRISDKARDICCLVEEVLQPDTNLASLYESRVFDEQEKHKIFDLYKKLMVANRRAVELYVLNDEKLDAAFIRDFTREWAGIKLYVVGFIRKLRESWEKKTEEGERARYIC